MLTNQRAFLVVLCSHYSCAHPSACAAQEMVFTNPDMLVMV